MPTSDRPAAAIAAWRPTRRGAVQMFGFGVALAAGLGRIEAAAAAPPMLLDENGLPLFDENGLPFDDDLT